MKFIATAMMSMLFSACHSNASIGSSNDTDTLRADGQWQEVEATDISENAVKLFAKDWMALATGNKEKMNAMTISWGSLGQLWDNSGTTLGRAGSDRLRVRQPLHPRTDGSQRPFHRVAFPERQTTGPYLPRHPFRARWRQGEVSRTDTGVDKGGESNL